MYISRIRYIVFAAVCAFLLFLGLTVVGRQSTLMAAAQQQLVVNESTTFSSINYINYLDIVASNWISQEVDNIGREWAMQPQSP